MFIGVGIEDHQRTGAETFDLANIVLAKPAPLVESARVCKHVSPACSIDMEVNSLPADRTLCDKRVKSLPNEQLYQLRNPYR